MQRISGKPRTLFRGNAAKQQAESEIYKKNFDFPQNANHHSGGMPQSGRQLAELQQNDGFNRHFVAE
ncbi:MAG: hypothetical protein MJZ64_07830 [Paludibacteraceae bacterium]|nr:hypothetical protein [Paludibacteraceae bacterium]